MKLSLGFSPCPNDTFIFDALVNGKIDTGDLTFETHLEDIHTLNTWAATQKLDITKLSFPAFFPQADHYTALDAGAALGKGVGPLLVAKQPMSPEEITTASIAIPGESTTANFLLQYAYPSVNNKVPMLFSDIEDAVCNGITDLGVIIHENRFTYQQKGLVKIADLGEIWETREKTPLPLACIAIRKSLPDEVKLRIEKLIRESVEDGFSQYPSLSSYVTSHAQAMEEDVMRKHISLYVNEQSASLGPLGRQAILTFYNIYASGKSEATATANLFLR